MECSSIVMLFYLTSPTSHKGIVLLYKAIQKNVRKYTNIIIKNATLTEVIAAFLHLAKTDYFAYLPILFRSIHF